MGFSLRSFALRSVVLGFGLVLAAPIVELNAASLLSPGQSAHGIAVTWLTNRSYPMRGLAGLTSRQG